MLQQLVYWLSSCYPLCPRFWHVQQFLYRQQWLYASLLLHILLFLSFLSSSLCQTCSSGFCRYFLLRMYVLSWFSPTSSTLSSPGPPCTLLSVMSISHLYLLVSPCFLWNPNTSEILLWNWRQPLQTIFLVICYRSFQVIVLCSLVQRY